MGVDFSKEAGRPPLSIACVAKLSQIDATQFHTFHQAIQSARASTQRCHSTRGPLESNDPHVDADGDHIVDHTCWRAYDLPVAHLESALELSAIAPHDRTVLERLFTIMDRSGDDVVQALELLIAITLLVQGPFSTKVELAVNCLLQDLHDTPLARTHLVFLVSAMTTVANYFGDPLLPLPVIEEIADDVFQELCYAPDFDSLKPLRLCDQPVTVLVQALATHPFVQEYISQDKAM